LWRLSPFGPIFGKELRATARRRRSYALRVLYLAALLLALLLAWSATSTRTYNTSVSAQAQAQAELGRMFFNFFCAFSVTAMAAIGPVLTATAVSAERLGKTLHVLLMTPITTWQIISGKLFSRLLVALTLMGLSLPALALVRLLGGVELLQMGGILALCVSVVIATASLGLLFSTFINRAYATILLSYGAMLFLYVFVPFILYFGFELNTAAQMWVYGWINWGFCAGMIAEPRGMPTWNDWVPCVLVHLGLGTVLVASSALILRRTARRAGAGRGAPAPVPSDTGEAKAQATIEPPTQSEPPTRPERPRPLRDVSDRPVLWREVRRPLMNKPWQSFVGAAVTVVFLLVVYAVLHGDDLLDEEETQAGFAWIFNLIVWLLTCVLSATAIAQEKESDTWTLLLTTPLSGRAIVWGKVLGLYRRLLWPGALITAHFLAFTVAGVIGWPAFFLTIWVIFSFNSIWAATGVYLSLRSRKVTFAVILNLLLGVGAYLVVFLVLVVFGMLWDMRVLPELVGWYLPYFYLAEGLTTDWSRWAEEQTRLPMEVRATGLDFLVTTAVVGVVQLGLASLILQMTARAFDRIVRRASQAARPWEPPPAAAPAA
jgi:ABC-type transport system involved in multi-copper enzyme maturation permease subunit